MAATKEYFDFIGSVKDRIRSAQYEALKAINKELVGLYWDIGRMISEKQKELGWGKSVVENIAKDLSNEFPAQRGFSTTNIWLMVQFYIEYHNDTILQSVIGEIAWTHNIRIFTKCKEPQARLFYINATKSFGWSTRVLEHQIDNKTYEKYLLNQTNYDHLPVEKFKDQKVLAIKDHYTFDFLDLSEKHSERELEIALIRNIQGFLLELGGDFSFMGSQYKLILGGEKFFIDLLLFHRELQCLVAIELKAGGFKPEYKGKMEFYLNVLNDFHRKPHENEAIGIIICKDKNRIVVEYALKKTQNPIGIASYSTGPDLPEYYDKALPSAEQIERGLGLLKGDG
jgi:predicted nuclease of restriction endonuclease-like (RecB) superfamily